MRVKDRIKIYLKESIGTYEKMLVDCVDDIERGALALVDTYFKNGGTVFTF